MLPDMRMTSQLSFQPMIESIPHDKATDNGAVALVESWWLVVHE